MLSPAPEEFLVPVTPLDSATFAPFGQYLAADPDAALIGVRDGESWMLNILSYDHRGLVVDHLNAHHRATQALFPLGSQPALLVVAPAGTTFDDRSSLGTLRAFVLDGTAGVNLGFGTWHWGPYPVGAHVDLFNLQGAGFSTDNEVAYLERDLGVVVRAVL